MILASHIIAAAKAHAIAEYPKESCGVVVQGEYVPCANTAEHPEADFRIDGATYAELHMRGPVQAILHSHPNGPYFPSQRDMQSQIATAVPWGIIVTDGERASDPEIWGDMLPIPGLVGRTFMHGIRDCYSLIRDAYRLGPSELSAQGIADWPIASVTLPDVPRDDAWWEAGQDLYLDGLKPNGFREISRSDVRPGDGFLMQFGKSKTLCHAGLYVGNNLILHHLPGRLSRREPAGLWARAVEMWVRLDA
jgi:proteasome lid subunit RPN8/RPN11